MTMVERQTSEVGIFNPPEIVLENARTAARALASVISQKVKPFIINGEQYLEFDDWQLVGQFYGYTVRTGNAVPVEVDGVKGAKAHADLIDKVTGMSLGGAEAYCMRDEDKWNTRPKYEWQGEGADRRRVRVGDEVVPWFQLASMAQTRAGAKALRNRLAWVVVLAGYRPTPAEEMTSGTVSEVVEERRTVDTSAHYCSVHKVNFFKKGRMKGYSHPIEGTNPVEWCNEPPEEKPTPKPEPTSTPADAGQASKPVEDKVSSNPPTEKPEPAKKAGVKSGNPTIPEFKTAVELFNFALGHGVSLETIKSKTGYASPAQVVDLKAAAKALYP